MEDEIKYFALKRKMREELKKTHPNTLLNYLHKGGLTDYLKTLSDEELQRAELHVTVTDITGDNERIYDVIRQEKEYRQYKSTNEVVNKGKSI